jgi:hypothetical protein
MTTRQIPLISPSWWGQHDTPRWVLAAGAVAMLALTYGIDRYNAAQDAKADEVRGLVDSARDFQSFAAAFASEMFNQKVVSAETRTRLIENLNDQYARSRELPEKIAKAAQPELADFQRNVLAMNDAIHKTSDIPSMQEFWTAASNLTVARKHLNEKLQTLI